MRRGTFLLIIGLSVAACAGSKPPTLESSRAEVLDDDKTGMIVRVHANGHNPNPFPVPLTSARGSLAVEGVDMGEVVVTSDSVLAPNASSAVVVDVKVPWKRVAYAIGKTKPVGIVRYGFDGVVTFDARGAKRDLSLSQAGSVDKTVVALAAIRHIGLPDRLPSAR